MARRLLLHNSERFDKTQFDQLQGLLDNHSRRVVRMLGQPRLTAADIAACNGAVLDERDTAITIAGGDLDITIGQGLDLVVASLLGEAGLAPAGELLELESADEPDLDAALVGAAPTPGHPTMVLARASSIAPDSNTPAERVYWNTGLPGTNKEDTQVYPETEEHYAASLTWVDTSVPGAVAGAEAAGYSKVATINSAGAVTWHHFFPEPDTGLVRLPGGAIRSQAQMNAAIASQLATIIGGGADWPDLPTATLNSLDVGLTLAVAIITDPVFGNGALDTRVAALETDLPLVAAEVVAQDLRLDALEAPPTCVAKAGAVQTIVGAGTMADLVLGGADFYDPAGMHDPGGANPERITIPSAGFYCVLAWASFEGDGAPGEKNSVRFGIETDGGTIIAASRATEVLIAETHAINASGGFYFAAPGWVKCYLETQFTTSADVLAVQVSVVKVPG